MTPPDWKSAIEIHPPDWVCPAERFWVAGWVASPSGLVPVDVRARLGGRVFLGLCGLPRPDKEIETHGRAGPPQAGFSFLLSPVSGAHGLCIEVCDQTGRWTEIFRQTVTHSGDTPPAAAAEPSTRLLLRLLRAKHARPRENWSSLASEILLAENAESFDVMPSIPFHGALEEMESLTAAPYDHVLVTGWVAHREQRITGLTAFLDTAAPLPLVHGLARPDAGTLFPGLVDGANSRFAGYLRIPLTAPRPLALRIFAELADGRRELVFLKRFHPVLTSGYGTDLPPFSAWKFTAAAWALRSAGGATDRALLRAAWHEFRMAAPVLHLPPAHPADSLPTATRALRVTIVTHNLNFEGAPLFAVEYARHLASLPGWSVQIVAAQEGPLRATFAAAGLSVTVVDPAPLLSARGDEEFAAALDRLAAGWPDADVIVANTVVSFWAVHLAHRLRKPSLFYVHESASIRHFFALQLATPALERAERAFELATRTVFIAADAQRVHAALGGRGNFRTLPGWIDAARIRAYAAAHSRAELRRRFGVPDGTMVFANIGSLLPRKGQHVFLEAVARLRQSAAGQSFVCWLVGAKGGTDPYADLLRHTVAALPLPEVQILAQSADAYQYFLAADVCVCSSLEEVFPRVVMEAALFGRLIVSTNVNGIPEMLGPDDAWLVPPDDAGRLAEAMQAARDAHRRGDFSRGERARAAVGARFDAAMLLPRHADLIRTVAALPLD
ncbi:MAG: glycosyltransferase family 4 protein [Opitutae bacterium]|nr:glycosyltransferase family 4 protein [Opitutae bacterium]